MVEGLKKNFLYIFPNSNIYLSVYNVSDAGDQGYQGLVSTPLGGGGEI